MLFIMFIRTSANNFFKLKSIKVCRIFIGVAIWSMVAFLVFLVMYRSHFNYYRAQSDIEIYKNYTGPKTILLGTFFHDDPKWSLPAGTLDQTFFEENQCLHTNCIITNNREYLPSITFYDAIVFHSARIFPNNTVPSNRSPEQLYVCGINESPVNTQHNFDEENNFYNLTMTYRLESDIRWYYGLIRDIETKEVVAPAFKPHWKNPPDNFTPDEALSKIIKGKTKKTAWFVSHCFAQSHRDDLAVEMHENISLEVYGHCGKFKCGNLQSPECYDLLDKYYKFYLSFENSLCEDYVTEKLYHALEHDVVPIVYGGADYNRFAPPNSYINVEDFPTISALKKYLKYVDSNQTEYNKYFWWKKHYEVAYETPFCQLCAILNTPSLRHKKQTYNNIRDWWGNYCRRPKIVFDY